MVDTPTTNYQLRQQSLGTNTNTWGDTKLNEALQDIDQIFGTIKTIAITGDYTITSTNYVTTADNKNAGFKFTGTLTTNATITLPSVSARFFINNSTTGNYSLVVKTAAGASVTVPASFATVVYTDAIDALNGAITYVGTSYTPSGVPGAVANVNYVDTAITTAINAASSGLSGGFASAFQYTATGGETSKSGADDNGNTLTYTPGVATEVFLNGVRLAPADYVATTGTSITGLSALVSGDILSIKANAVFSVAGTYTQAQVDALIAAFLAAAHTWPLAQTFTAAASFTAIPTGAGLVARFAAPGPIGSVTPSTGDFTTIGATTRGTIAATTGNFNSTLTVSAGGAAITGQSVLTNTSAGAGAIALSLKNASGTAGTEVILDFDPTNNGPGVRSASVSASTDGSNSLTLNFKTSNGGANTTRMSIGPTGTITAGSATVAVIDAVGLLGLKSYTVGTLPTASPAGRMIYVSDGTSNKRQAVSDATNWRFPDGAIVS